MVQRSAGREVEWHILARWVSVGVLLVLSLLAGRRDIVPSAVPLLGICLFVAAYNSALFIAISRLENYRHRLAFPACLLDIVALTAYLHYSGDIENPLFFAYTLPVASGAILLGRRQGLWLAAVAFLLFSSLVAFTYLDVLAVNVPHHHLSLLHDDRLHELIDPDLVGAKGADFIGSHLLVLGFVLFGSAYGFGTLAERIRQGEKELAGQRDNMLLLLRILPDGAVLLRKDGTLLLANASAQRMIEGLREGTINGHDEGAGIVARISAFNGSVQEFETNVRGRVLAHALASDRPDGPFVWVLRDVTEQRQLLGQVMHASKMADLGLLAAGIAHEIGNPLSTMSAIVQVLQTKNPPLEFSDRLRALGASVERISQIVQDIGTFARPTEGRRSPLSIPAVVDKTAAIFRLHDKSKEVKLEIDCPRNLPSLQGVEDQLIQVLLNLLLNAADASDGHGTVWLAARVDGNALAISVRDQGTGIDPELQKRLFTPFFTTKEQGKGQGLGLFISDSIVHGHGGRIDVRSTPGAGSTFTIRLPLGAKGA